jgi:quinol-cytochrome oxidoreductase complex cytochrome b subunit
MLATLLLFAQEEAEPSKAPFYIAAGVLVVYALLLSAVGIRRHETFPPSQGVRNGLIFVCLILVAAAAYTAVITG